MRTARTCFIAIMVSAAIAVAQERTLSITAFGTFTTSSKLFPHPNVSDDFTRGEFLPIDDFLSTGLEIRKEFRELRSQIGISVEYITSSKVIQAPVSSTSVPVEDGFSVYPIELTGYFIIPFGGEAVHIFMGGGGGVYFGVRSYQYANASAIPVHRTIGAGIHVVTGAEYTINELISLRSMLKFRDVQFESENRFTATTTVYNGTAISLSQDPLESRVNIDGMAITVGIAFHF